MPIPDNIVIRYLLKNKEWLFSGVGVSVMVGLVRLIIPKRGTRPVGDQLPNTPRGKDETPIQNRPTQPIDIPKEWQITMPPKSRFAFTSETRSDIPLGSQSFSFEYGPEGHAKPLMLKNAMVRAEVEFTCRIDNPRKAMFGANDFALNVLPPRFMTDARNILETYSLSKLRESRLEASRAIVTAVAPRFYELGVRLESVSIGALERV